MAPCRSWLLEVVGDQLLHHRDTGGATNKYNLVHRALVGLDVTDDLLNWLNGATEEVSAKVLEASAGDGRAKSTPSNRESIYNMCVGR